MVVLDCSVVLDLLVLADYHPAGLPADSAWCAPVLLDIEIVSGLRGLVMGGISPGGPGPWRWPPMPTWDSNAGRSTRR